MAKMNNEMEMKVDKKTSVVTVLAMEAVCLANVPVGSLNENLLRAVDQNDLAHMR